MFIENPVLPGFHPDPSICRVGEDYYIATSTFQWWPGVRLHHSRDLVHFRPIGYALTKPSQLDMTGNEDNAGVWAPCLSFHDGLFYLVYANVRSWTGVYKDAHNYLVTAPHIEGPWSEPVHLNSSGFDASLFHDDDGRKWLLNMQWDFRPSRNPFSGILLQEYDVTSKRLTGPVEKIFSGTHHGLVEGPHLYKKDGYYYLLTAEGGTSWGHAVTVARSRQLTGPYEVMPQNPLLSSKYDMTLPLQRAGHGSLVVTQTGKWYLAHLCGRPVMPERRCTLGRETAIQSVIWDNTGWPRLATGGHAPALKTPAPRLGSQPFDADSKTIEFFDHFDGLELDLGFNTLREPPDETWISCEKRPSHLRLVGRESLFSKHRQSLVARRITGFQVAASTVLDFAPRNFQQMAGLIFYYDCIDHHYLHVTSNDAGQRCLRILTSEAGNNVAYPGVEQPLEEGPVYLKGEMRYGELQFFFAQKKGVYSSFGPVLDATVLSDEYKVEVKFTGAFAGICAQDLSGSGVYADFDWFEMESLPKG